jgi:hypothetical protein
MTGRLWTSIALAPLLLSAAACDRHKAPSDKLAQSASELVGAKEPEPAPLAQGPYAPRDTCHDLPGAEEFREKLAEAVMARDSSAFVALAAEDIKLDFGGGTGRAELKKRLTSKDWMLWDELDDLLALGCAANSQGGLTIPWYFEQHIDKVDQTSGMLVVGEKVPLLAAPDPKGKPIEAISWDVVTLNTLKPDDPFQHVTTLGGAKGYIATEKLRSLLDYRLLASRRNGKWSVVSLVSGD